MLAEFKIINDPLRPSISTNLCSICYRNKKCESNRIGCCTYEPEFCLFDLVYLYLHYPDIYDFLLKKGQIISGYNGIMIEMKTGSNHCPFVSNFGCVLPKDAAPPLCRLFICREAAMFAPAMIEERLDEYVLSKEYQLNHYLNGKVKYNQDLTSSILHNFIGEFSQTVNTMIKGIKRIDPPIKIYKKEIDIEDFGLLL